TPSARLSPRETTRSTMSAQGWHSTRESANNGYVASPSAGAANGRLTTSTVGVALRGGGEHGYALGPVPGDGPPDVVCPDERARLGCHADGPAARERPLRAGGRPAGR